MQLMEKLKMRLLNGKLDMDFECNKVSYSNTDLVKKIKSLNPYTVDWSNVPDYLHREEFLAIAKEVSGEDTVHYMHSMNWGTRVLGTFIGDYPDERIEGIIKDTEETFVGYHQAVSSVDPLNR